MSIRSISNAGKSIRDVCAVTSAVINLGEMRKKVDEDSDIYNLMEWLTAITVQLAPRVRGWGKKRGGLSESSCAAFNQKMEKLLDNMIEITDIGIEWHPVLRDDNLPPSLLAKRREKLAQLLLLQVESEQLFESVVKSFPCSSSILVCVKSSVLYQKIEEFSSLVDNSFLNLRQICTIV